jgi:iron complex outermembrane recepter protein
MLGEKYMRHCLIITLLASVAAVPAIAQTAPSAEGLPPPADSVSAPSEPEQGVGDIVVTAQRRAERLQEVPIAIAAFSNEQLRDSGVISTNGLAAQVPNLTVKSQFGTTNPNIFLRGVGSNDFNENASPAIGTYIDEVYIAAPAGQFSSFYDLERVEVLKGPQGTLYGKNTTGGAFNIITAKPVFGEYEGYVRAGYGNYNRFLAEGAINVPLGDNLAARFAFILNERDGFITNSLDGTTVNDISTRAARLQLRWEPSPDHILTLQGNVSRNRSDKAQGAFQGLNTVLAPGCTPLVNCTNNLGIRGPNDDPFTQSYNTTGQMNNEQRGLIFRYEGKLSDSLSLVALTGYNFASQRIPFDIDNSAASLLASFRWSDAKQLSQELRLSSTFDGPFNFIAGLYYLDEKVDVTSTFEFFGNGTITRQAYRQEARSYAGFLQTYLEFTDTLKLNAGIRYTRDERDFNLNARNETGSSLLLRQTPAGARIISQQIPAQDRTVDFSRVTGRVGLDYQPTRDALIYGYVARGYKAGGFNGGATASPFQLEPVRPEELTAYEIGFKTEWFDRKLRVNGAAFYYDYKDLQVFTVVNAAQFPGVSGVLQVLANAANAKIKGAEIEVVVAPVDGLQLSVAAAYLNATYKNFFVAQSATVTEDRSGSRLIGAPKFDLTASGQYRTPTSFGSLTVRGEVIRKGSRYYDTQQNDPLSFVAPAYTLGNVSLIAANEDDTLKLRMFVDNVTDERYFVEAVDVRALGFRQLYFGDPRTYGAEVTFRF